MWHPRLCSITVWGYPISKVGFVIYNICVSYQPHTFYEKYTGQIILPFIYSSVTEVHNVDLLTTRLSVSNCSENNDVSCLVPYIQDKRMQNANAQETGLKCLEKNNDFRPKKPKMQYLCQKETLTDTRTRTRTHAWSKLTRTCNVCIIGATDV